MIGCSVRADESAFSRIGEVVGAAKAFGWPENVLTSFCSEAAEDLTTSASNASAVSRYMRENL